MESSAASEIGLGQVQDVDVNHTLENQEMRVRTSALLEEMCAGRRERREEGARGGAHGERRTTDKVTHETARRRRQHKGPAAREWVGMMRVTAAERNRALTPAASRTGLETLVLSERGLPQTPPRCARPRPRDWGWPGAAGGTVCPGGRCPGTGRRRGCAARRLPLKRQILGYTNFVSVKKQ